MQESIAIDSCEKPLLCHDANDVELNVQKTREVRVTMRDFLVDFKQDQWVLSFSGGWHFPNSPKFIFENVWKYTITLMNLVYFGYMIYGLYTQVVHSTVPYYALIMVIGLFQIVILFPIIRAIHLRLNLEMTVFQQSVYLDVIHQCKLFLLSSIAATVIGAILFTVDSIRSGAALNMIVVSSFFMAWFPAINSIMSTWAVFSISLDAMTVQSELSELIKRAKSQDIQLEDYLSVHERLRKTLIHSLSMCDEVSLLCYTNVLVCVVIILIGTDSILFDIGLSLMFLREGLMIGLCFPSIMKANECYDRLTQELAERSNLKDIAVEVTYSRLWNLAKERPLHILVLGRKMVPGELRYQVYSFLLMLLIGVSSMLMRDIVH